MDENGGNSINWRMGSQDKARGEKRSAVAAVGRGVDRDTRDRGRDRGRPAALGERDRDHSVSPGAMMAPAIAT